jgi:hypothetical protein
MSGYNIEGGAESHKEKSPSANDNLISCDQELKEKTPNTTQNNDNPSLPNNAPDVNHNISEIGLEPKEEGITSSLNYEEKEPSILACF